MTWIGGQFIPIAQHWFGRTAAVRGSEWPTDEGFGWRGAEVPSEKPRHKPLEMHSLPARGWQRGCIPPSGPENSNEWRGCGIRMNWTPNKVTLLRVLVGFAAVSLFGRGAWANLTAVGLTVASIALDALDGHIARTKKLATPVGAQVDILGDRMIENVYFTYFAVRSEEHTSELQ